MADRGDRGDSWPIVAIAGVAVVAVATVGLAAYAGLAGQAAVDEAAANLQAARAERATGVWAGIWAGVKGLFAPAPAPASSTGADGLWPAGAAWPPVEIGDTVIA